MISSYELFEIESEYVTADLICWLRYKRPCYGIVEAMLEANPHIAVVHQQTPFIPPGTIVRVPIDLDILNGNTASSVSGLWTGSNPIGAPP